MNVLNYAFKISSASDLELVIINYQIIIDYLSFSKNYINNKNEFIFIIKKARIFLSELRASLNMKYEISKNLMICYNYIDKILAYAMFNKNEKYIDKAIYFLQKLLNSWLKIKDGEKEQKNLDEIFYINKKSTLDEYVDFKA